MLYVQARYWPFCVSPDRLASSGGAATAEAEINAVAMMILFMGFPFGENLINPTHSQLYRILASVIHRFLRDFCGLFEQLCHFRRWLIVIDHQFANIPVTGHSSKRAHIQLFRQPGDGQVSGVVESKVGNHAGGFCRSEV